jgi:hypothetical protein
MLSDEDPEVQLRHWQRKQRPPVLRVIWKVAWADLSAASLLMMFGVLLVAAGELTTLPASVPVFTGAAVALTLLMRGARVNKAGRCHPAMQWSLGTVLISAVVEVCMIAGALVVIGRAPTRLEIIIIVLGSAVSAAAVLLMLPRKVPAVAGIAVTAVLAAVCANPLATPVQDAGRWLRTTIQNPQELLSGAGLTGMLGGGAVNGYVPVIFTDRQLTSVTVSRDTVSVQRQAAPDTRLTVRCGDIRLTMRTDEQGTAQRQVTDAARKLSNTDRCTVRSRGKTRTLHRVQIRSARGAEQDISRALELEN